MEKFLYDNIVKIAVVLTLPLWTAAVLAEDIEEVIVDTGAAKGQTQPILVHAKANNKAKSNKPSAA